MDNNIFELTDIAAALKINEDNLEGEMAVCPSQFFSHASLVVDAEQLEENFKLAKEARAADIARSLKSQDSKGVMKEADLNRACREDTRWLELHEKETEYHSYVKKLKSAANGFEMKSRMLMSLNRRSLFKMSQGMSGDLPYKSDDY
jgi:hypothetical protein